MNWLTQLFSRRRHYAELSESIREHLDEKIDDLMEDGMSREEAERTARREFGNVTLIEERSREVWQWPRLENLWADIRLASRQLLKSPGFTITAVLTLALGIGANTGIFTLMHTLLLRSLPISDPDRLVRIAINIDSPNDAAHESPLNFILLQEIERHAKSFSGVFGWSSYDFVLKEETGLRGYSGAVVSGNTFQVLGIEPAAGRLLSPADDQRGGGPDGWAAVISHRFWQQHYHADPSVIGKHITLTDHSVTIVGVTPQGFEGVLVGMHPDFYLPLEYEPVMRGAGSVLRTPGSLWLTVMARLKPGISLSTASAEMTSLYRVVMDETLPPAVRHLPVIEKAQFAVRPGRTGWSLLRLQYTRPLFLLQALVGVVLLVCCINLAGLCIARAATREHEFAIRGALGAARFRLMQQPLVESLLLAILGSLLAIVFAWTTDRFLLQFLSDREAAESLSVRPDLSTMLVTGGCAIVCALLFGIAPAWLASHTPIETALRRSGRNGLASGGTLRRFFVPVQIALSLTLVVVAALLSTTVAHLRAAHLGFRTENVLLVPADFERLPQKGLDLVHLYRQMASRMEQTPGVDSASVAENTPLNGWRHMGTFAGAGASHSAGQSPDDKYEINDVGSHYFATMGTQMLAGRDFTDQDADANTCILNRSAADALFPLPPPIGQTAHQIIRSMNSGQLTTQDCQVIGIVEDAKYASLRDPAPPTVYLPFGTNTSRLFSMSFVIHARTLAEGKAAYRKVLHEFASASPEVEPVAFSVQFNDSIARERLLSVLSGFFAALVLLLSGIGIYGLVASDVTQRTTEIGVRMALGSTRVGILLLIMKRVTVLLLFGMIAGGLLAFFAARSIRAFLFDVMPNNLAIFASAALILAISGFVAAMFPARRAVSVEPVRALRAE